MKTQAGAGMRWPQAKERQGPPEAPRGKKAPPLELHSPATGWAPARTPASRTGRQEIPVVLSHSWSTLSWPPQDDHTSDFLDGGQLGNGGAGVGTWAPGKGTSQEAEPAASPYTPPQCKASSPGLRPSATETPNILSTSVHPQPYPQGKPHSWRPETRAPEIY